MTNYRAINYALYTSNQDNPHFKTLLNCESLYKKVRASRLSNHVSLHRNTWASQFTYPLDDGLEFNPITFKRDALASSSFFFASQVSHV